MAAIKANGKNLVLRHKADVKPSKATKERVARRLALANRPYVAHRRNFAPMHVKALRIGRALGKTLLWTI